MRQPSAIIQIIAEGVKAAENLFEERRDLEDESLTGWPGPDGNEWTTKSILLDQTTDIISRERIFFETVHFATHL